MGQKGIRDGMSADQEVMIAQDRVAQRAMDPAKNFGAMIAHAHREVPRQRPGANEVSGQYDKIGLRLVHPADDCLQKSRFGVFLEMKIADLHDLEAREGVRQAG